MTRTANPQIDALVEAHYRDDGPRRLASEHEGNRNGTGRERAECENELDFKLKPRELKFILDRDVIGQEDAKRVISNAVCYHYARCRRDRGNGHDSDTAVKKNLLMIGPTGVGKTFLTKKVASIVGVPFIKSDATKYSATGYVGDKVENMIVELYMAADGDKRMAQYGIVYLDEVDKIRSQNSWGKDVSGVEVQRGLLKLLEETEIKVPRRGGMLGGGMDIVNTKHILFIASGAFPGMQEIVERKPGPDYDAAQPWYAQVMPEHLVDYGFEAEFVGRFPVRVGLHELSEADLLRILKESRDSVVKQYVADFASFDIAATFDDDALRYVAGRAVAQGTGARGLTSVFETCLTDYLFELPSCGHTQIHFTADMLRAPEAYIATLMHQQEETSAQ